MGNFKNNSKVIFPSDFIYFYYYKHLSPGGVIKYLYRLFENNKNYKLYIGRIKAVSKNYINNFKEYIGEIIFIINEYININFINK